MDIHTLMYQFAQFAGAKVGLGPRHPNQPNLDIAHEVDRFLEQYPFLRYDLGYVEFLECYAGASILKQGTSLTVDILGFAGSSVCSHMLEMEGSIIDEEEYLLFGYVVLETKPLASRQISFGFDSTQRRQPGVYRYSMVTNNHLEKQWHWYCATFLEWLERLIKYQGRLDE